MDIRITDLFEHMHGQYQGSGYISPGNDQAECIAKQPLAQPTLLEDCA